MNPEASSSFNAALLPVRSLDQAIDRTLEHQNRLLLWAPTGSGKTTQVPPMLLKARWRADRQIVVLQPRRLAARLVSQRVAQECGSRLGELVGYQTRYESALGPNTKILFLTEGLFLRQLQASPHLDSVAAVILDEFHERSLMLDLSLALVKQLQESSRPDLRLVVMSATLEVQSLKDYLKAPLLESPGRMFPVEISHVAQRSAKPIWETAAMAVAEILDRTDQGDLLVFMPGAYEIRRTIEACRRMIRLAGDVGLYPLHGSLTLAEQNAAVAHEPSRRKVIVATNVAETSITLPNVRHVIDSGLAKILRYDARRGINALLTEPISQASATQRAGRAGRTAAGSCLRLWPASEHRSRAAQTTSEIQRVELSQSLLQWLTIQSGKAEKIQWNDLLEPPPAPAIERAIATLRHLQAIDGKDCLTPLGQTMAQLPVHPRLAKLIVQVSAHGGLKRASLWAAILSEPPLMMTSSIKKTVDMPEQAGRESDLILLEHRFGQAMQADFDPAVCQRLQLNAAIGRQVHHTQRLLESAAIRAGLKRQGQADDATMLQGLLAAYPDHLAIKRDDQSFFCAMSGQKRVELSPSSVVRKAGPILALEIQEQAAAANRHSDSASVKTVLSMASSLETGWIEAVLGDRIHHESVVQFNEQTQVVEQIEQRTLDGLVLDSIARPCKDASAAAEVLAKRIEKGLLKLDHWDESVQQWIARVRCAAVWFPQRKLIQYDEMDLAIIRQQIIHGALTAKQAAERPCLPTVREALNWDDQQWLEKIAPESLKLPSGYRMKIEYQPGQPPRGRAKIQDFYDLKQHPTVAGGRVKLLLEILGPNFRPLQVTDDLTSFWTNLYPQIRPALARRYPRHVWRPANPQTP